MLMSLRHGVAQSFQITHHVCIKGGPPFTSQVAFTENYLQSEDVYIKQFYLQLIFEGIRGRNFRGDAAIDDVMIYDC